MDSFVPERLNLRWPKSFYDYLIDADVERRISTVLK